VQGTRAAMVKAHYDMAERLQGRACARVLHYIEANFIQDSLIEDYVKESEERSYMLPIREDKRQKPNKQGRIENMMVYWERGLMRVDAQLLKGEAARHWQNLKDQLVAFPQGHDDGPDALEGAIYKVNEHARMEQPISLGAQRRSNKL
jgi:predicted phage terminase large subunit-like protein